MIKYLPEAREGTVLQETRLHSPLLGFQGAAYSPVHEATLPPSALCGKYSPRPPVSGGVGGLGVGDGSSTTARATESLNASAEGKMPRVWEMENGENWA